jgi:GTP pyrophosphokinase
MDDVTIAAALLHDAVEDTVVTLDEIEEDFGVEVRDIVDGVTKLERFNFDTKEEQQAATMRKMLVAMAQDLRVLVIKLADRLHNMRTIAAMPAWKQERTAQETLDIYAPLAHRLGMQEVKTQLEDLSFAALYPKRFAEIDHMVAQRASGRDQHLADVVAQLRERMDELHIAAEVVGREKHLWSIYEKMVVRNKDFDEILDLVGVRVVVESSKDCYAALGSIHSLWKPVVGRFKDYVAMPKFNLYQSLHTTVIGPGGRPVEVQVRTQEMHRRAEWGVAAHFAYKEDGSTEDLAWISRLVDWQQEMTDPGEFMANLKIDLDQDEVFVFTPKGDVVTLPVGATPVDFAYAIHTEVGHRCIGARVAGRLVPLDSELDSGDTVEIFTSKVEGAGPSRDWLSFVATRSASNRIRQWFSRERREDALESGRELLVKALRREALPVQRVVTGPVVAEVAEQLKYQNAEALFTAIGEHHLSAESVAARIAKEVRTAEGEREEVVSTPVRGRPRGRNRPAGVHVEGFDDLLVRMARCCTPVPGDEIVGFVTRGRGVSVHRTDCANATSLVAGQSERIIDVDWDQDSSGDFVALIEVKGLDRPRLLQDVISTLSDGHVSIITSHSHAGTDRIATMRFEFELGDRSHLEVLLNRIRAIDSVYDADRVVPGAN